MVLKILLLKHITLYEGRTAPSPPGQGRRRCLSHKIILLATELIYGPSRDPHFIAPLSLVPSPEDVSPRAHEVNNIIFPVPAELLLRLQSFFFSQKGSLESFSHGAWCNVHRVRWWLSLGG